MTERANCKISKIEDYLGFPTGLFSEELATRASTQARKFGAKLMVADLESGSNNARAV